jgi:hypothetical protein
MSCALAERGAARARAAKIEAKSKSGMVRHSFDIVSPTRQCMMQMIPETVRQSVRRNVDKRKQKK